MDIFQPTAKAVTHAPSALSRDVPLQELRVAIIHYWFVSKGGGENVVESLAEIFPQADLFALVAEPERLPASLSNHTLHTSFLQKIPWARKFHRHFLLLHPMALEQFNLSKYDLVISSESGPAKGILTQAKTCHVCYCHSPMRYLWDMQEQYKAAMNPIVRAVYTVASSWLRVWDLATASRVDYFVANSNFVASRIRKIYRRESHVIYPPVDVGSAKPQYEPGEFYLCVGRLVDYKRTELAVEVCSRLGRRLKVVGQGPQLQKLKNIAGPTVEFVGFQSDNELRDSYAHCRALLFPGEEDFGIVPVEAQSFGRPVIAYGSGGSLETVRGNWSGKDFMGNETGIFFAEQTVSSLEKAILHFESLERNFSPQAISAHASQFQTSRFQAEMLNFLAACYAEHRRNFGSNSPKASTEHGNN
jgi:glycosyltransferase involved in cell wall biosynthesis